MNKKNKLIIIGSIILFIVILVISTVYFLTPRSYLKISAAPDDVYIKIDSNTKQKTKNGNTINLEPGTHTISISRDEFSTYTENINIKNRETIEILTTLNPLTENARTILRKSSQSVIERSTAKKIDKASENMVKFFPLVRELPITARLYNIYACKSVKYSYDSTKIAICINGINQDDNDIKLYIYNHVKSLGYNLDDYEVIWNISSN